MLRNLHSDHLNSLDPDIKSTTEGEEDRALAFLDTVIKPDGSLDIKIYPKSTHTDQYLNFSSNHPSQHKLGVIQTLFYRAESVITDPAVVEEEKHHITQALARCGYPKWAFDRINNPKIRTNQIPTRTVPRNQKDRLLYHTSKVSQRPFGEYMVPTVYAVASNQLEICVDF